MVSSNPMLQGYAIFFGHIIDCTEWQVNPFEYNIKAFGFSPKLLLFLTLFYTLYMQYCLVTIHSCIDSQSFSSQQIWTNESKNI